jgi:Na+/H+ antiporter NhaD/arsenite permease-like protein
MIFIPTLLAVLSMLFVLWLFYKNVIKPEQEFKMYMEEKYRRKIK